MFAGLNYFRTPLPTPARLYLATWKKPYLANMYLGKVFPGKVFIAFYLIVYLVLLIWERFYWVSCLLPSSIGHFLYFCPYLF
jgi:hypothetical protein